MCPTAGAALLSSSMNQIVDNILNLKCGAGIRQLHFLQPCLSNTVIGESASTSWCCLDGVVVHSVYK